MESGLLIALAFAVAIIALALLLGRLGKGKRDPHDINGSRRDGDAAATWTGIREAGRDDGDT